MVTALPFIDLDRFFEFLEIHELLHNPIATVLFPALPPGPALIFP
jgi:hypothetical protein